MRYLDTSLVVAAVTNESGTRAAQACLLDVPPGTLLISDWVITEFAAALAAKRRAGKLDEERSVTASRAFEALRDASLATVPVTASDFTVAAGFASSNQATLRAGDALHLAVASREGAMLHTLDRGLHRAAQALGLPSVLAISPEESGDDEADGVATNLRQALAEYSPTDRDQAGVPIEQLVAAMLEKHDIVSSLLHGCAFDPNPRLPAGERLAQHAAVLDFVLGDEDRKTRFLDQVLALVKVFALCASRDEAIAIRDDVRLFADVRAAIVKIEDPDSGRAGSARDIVLDTAIGQLVNEVVTGDEVVDVYKLAGLDTPELSILSDEFLDGLAGKDRPNLQLGLLRRLLDDQIKSIQRSNVVQARKFSELLDEAINRYTNRALTTAEIIAELVRLAKQVRDQATRHERLGLSAAEAAFYDAVFQNDAAVLELGDDTLKRIAVDLVHAVRASVTIDWTLKESVRAAMRAKVRRLLAKYDYPPDHEERAVELVLEQAELYALAA